MPTRVVAAVDMGASSGRVVAGVFDDRGVELDVVHRFPNGPVDRDGHLRWDLPGLWAQVQDGLGALARRYPQVESIGIDTWGVDYGLLDGDGRLLADPIAHRDRRTDDVIDAVHEQVEPSALYAINGLQFLPFTTLYQLVVEQRQAHWPEVAHVVLMPDLLAFLLTGELATERTNASTTGLLDVTTGGWSVDLLTRLDVDPGVLAPLVDPGTVLGTVRRELTDPLGLSAATVVTTVGSHDTASAVVGVPSAGTDHAYAISGTWSLVGLEHPTPVVTEAARSANFTNERGVGGTTRFLRNVGGLWLLQECLRSWASMGEPDHLGSLLAAAAECDEGPLIDVDDDAFIAPGAMPQRIADAVVATGAPPPATRPAIVRCIVDSLAAAYATTVEQADGLADHPVARIHVVGGGCQNELLCRSTARRSGRSVVAGPVEATALGNVVVQARARQILDADDAAPLVPRGEELRVYEPT